MDRWFGHSGDLGDIIYALPTIKAKGGGTLFLYHQDGKTWHGMNEQKVTSLRPLLNEQHYISDAVWCPNGHDDHNLNGFRSWGGNGRNLADMHLATHGLGPEHRHEPWLQVSQPLRRHSVIFHRTSRCRNDGFPWKRVWAKYHRVAAFVGHTNEHYQFCTEIGPVPYVPTADHLALAQMIAGCQLFAGNQSCPAAIAEGLKHRMILEVWPPNPNCNFERIGRINGRDDTFELPEL